MVFDHFSSDSFAIFHACVHFLPALMLYGAEAWALTKAAQKKLGATQRRMERRFKTSYKTRNDKLQE
uniref:Uncharacterized protein n=1 Tax=Steinernema glaseri TaxID=37863 RepID=A0A1I7ZX68_9BILA